LIPACHQPLFNFDMPGTMCAANRFSTSSGGLVGRTTGSELTDCVVTGIGTPGSSGACEA
jgi:hypothetical protein